MKEVYQQVMRVKMFITNHGNTSDKLAMDEVINYVAELERRLLDVKSRDHWTHKHIIWDEGVFVAHDEAGLEHGRYTTHDDARDALVLYSHYLQQEPT